MVYQQLKIKKLLGGLLLAVTLITGCKKFTEQPYDNRADIQTAEQYAQLLINAYPLRHDMFTDILTDDFDYHAQLAQASNIANYLPMYLWKDDYPDNIGSGPAVAYAEFYSKIFYTNLALEGIDAAPGTPEKKAAVKGEALLLRSYCHFILVNLFGMHYNPATASKNLGVPVVTTINKGNINYYRRNTVQEVYDKLEADAVEGLAQLKKAGTAVPSNPYHFSIAGANAFLARIKLYKGEWDEAVKYADAVIAEKGRNVRRLSDDLPFKKSNGIPFFANRFMDPALHSNILMISYSSGLAPITTTGFQICGFFASDSITPLYGTNDLRSQVFTSVGTVIDNRMMAIKFATQPNSPNNTPIRTPYFTMEEVLLTRAEAMLRSNNANAVTEALSDIEALRKERYRPYNPLNPAVGRQVLLNTVLLERRKEFYNEGLRWYDVKRLGIAVEHRLGRNEAPASVLAPNDLRRAIQIPRMEQERNSPITGELNPR